MTTLELPGEIEVAFDHLAGYGLAAILQAAGAARPRVAWGDNLNSRLRLDDAVDWDEAGKIVHDHAVRATSANSWVMADGPNDGGVSGLFSPRIKAMSGTEYEAWYRLRHGILDGLPGPDGFRRLDLSMVGALGEPAYWAHQQDGRALPDNGASRWEMKTRNRGEEFVTNRVRILARTVASRTAVQIADGLRGSLVDDEAGKNKSDSRTPTGLMAPRATDNARAWCALWGLSMMSVTHRVHPPNAVSPSAAHVGRPTAGAFALPVMTAPWPLSMLRSVIASSALREVAEPDAADASSDAWAWLHEQGVAGVVVFPIHRSANDKAPERWAQRGSLLLPADR